MRLTMERPSLKGRPFVLLMIWDGSANDSPGIHDEIFNALAELRTWGIVLPDINKDGPQVRNALSFCWNSALTRPVSVTRNLEQIILRADIIVLSNWQSKGAHDGRTNSSNIYLGFLRLRGKPRA